MSLQVIRQDKTRLLYAIQYATNVSQPFPYTTQQHNAKPYIPPLVLIKNIFCNFIISFPFFLLLLLVERNTNRKRAEKNQRKAILIKNFGLFGYNFKRVHNARERHNVGMRRKRTSLLLSLLNLIHHQKCCST